MKPRPFFVYELVDPRDGVIFYIGKGSKNRPAHHTRDAKAGKKTAKCHRIREILADGLEVGVVIVKRFRAEAVAFAYEKKQIELHGLDNLTNMQPGGPAEWAKKADPATVAEKNDAEMLRVLLKFAARSDGFKSIPPMRFGGQVFPMPEKFGAAMLGHLSGLVNRRGVEWCKANGSN
jgi:hypothetical protein